MDKRKQAAIEHHYADLMNSMDPLLIMDNLRAGLLSSAEKENIKESSSTRRDRNRELISILFRKREELKPFEDFVEALKKTDTSHEILAGAILNIYKVSRTSLSDAGKTEYSLQNAQRLLKDEYLTSFKKVHPFSLPFTFDIENTWVSLALKDDAKTSKATEDHAELLKTAFEKAKLLIIEGNPATGKTSLMRRLAYEWANENSELSHYDLIVYAEFREVREQTFESIADLVLEYTKNYIEHEELKDLISLLSNRNNCKQRKILLLLDGYDESSLDKQCNELTTYLTLSKIKKPLVFNIVITTRLGYLSAYRGNEGRFVFADVLGFVTAQQKKTYIFNHFKSIKFDNMKNIEAVHSLLANNENLNKLAETPLFLTFICLLHERIVDGTLLELYCNIIWWLIDRHQKNNPDRNVPALFGFQNGSSDKFETIQDHYLHFSQLHCLGNMALRNIQENVFKSSDCEQFNLQPIVEQVGFLRKEKRHDNSFKLATLISFPHRTIQEFLAAHYCFCSKDSTDEWLLPNSKLDTSKMKEFERFLLRIALSDQMPIKAEKRKDYFENIAGINLDTTFDALNTTAGFDNKLLNWFLSHCTKVKSITLKGTLSTARHDSNMLNSTSVHIQSPITSKIPNPTLLSFIDLIKLHSLMLSSCALEANSQLSIINCPSLKNLKFIRCEMKRNTNLGIATMPAIDIMEFDQCKFDCETWQSITAEIRNSSIKNLKLTFGNDFNKELLYDLQKCNNVEKMEITIKKYTIRQNDLLSISNMNKLQSLTFGGFDSGCTFEANSQLSIINCPSLKNLKFIRCEMKRNTNLGIATMPAIDIMEFDQCKFDCATWQSITAEIRKSYIKCLKLTFENNFNKKLLFDLQKCKNVEKMEITIKKYTIRQNDLLSISNMNKLQSLTFGGFDSGCTFEADSQLYITNCPSLKNLQFSGCKMERSTKLGIATMPSIDTVEFDQCKVDYATWQSIAYATRNSSIKNLKLTFGNEFNKDFLIQWQKCKNIEKMEIKIWDNRLCQNEQFLFIDLMKLHSLTFWYCTFEPSYQLSIINCPSLKNLKFNICEMKRSTNLGIATIPAIDTMEFNQCKFDCETWQSIADATGNSCIKKLKLTFGNEFNKEFLIHLQKCKNIEKIEIAMQNYKIRQDDLLSFSDLPAICTVTFWRCKIDMATWQSITNAIRNSSVKSLQLSADYLVKETYSEFLHHLQTCESIENIHFMDLKAPNSHILNRYEERVTTNLAQTAQKLPGLTSIAISDSFGERLDESRRLKEENKERIEKVGRKRNPDFLIKYVEWEDPELER